MTSAITGLLKKLVGGVLGVPKQKLFQKLSTVKRPKRRGAKRVPNCFCFVTTCPNSYLGVLGVPNGVPNCFPCNLLAEIGLREKGAKRALFLAKVVLQNLYLCL